MNPSSAKVDPPEPPTVLVVDDDAINIRVIESILLGEGLQVRSASSGQAALEVAQRGPIQLILLDVVMPGMNGLQVVESLKRNPATEGIPVIFITSRSKVEDIVEGFLAGGVDYIPKPFEPLEMLARVRTHLELKRRIDRERAMVQELQDALEQVRTLAGLIPICSHCKEVRDDHGYWFQVEEYISANSQATFSHGVCPTCIRDFFAEFQSESNPS